MSLIRTMCLVLALVCSGKAQEPDAEATTVEESVLPVKSVDLVLRDASWFVGTPATALVALPEVVEDPEEFGEGGDGVSVISIEVGDAEEGKGSVAVVTWLPRKEGLVSFPSLSFESETVRYQTAPRQLLVSSPQRSPEMELAITAGKSQVVAGEPLRVDIRWTCRVPTKRLRSMYCNPSFFNDPGIEVVVPRSTVPEEEQLGMPFGGRRVIAHLAEKDEGAGLGVVEFSMYLRFSEAGSYELPAVKLECARLKSEGGAFAPYAAYFNNGLFESIDEGEAYDRVFVESEPMAIEVLPLPEEGRLESFSGLFAPCAMELSAKPTETEVGQLIEVDILVRSDAPHGFLELPALTKQRALRSWFKVDSEYGRAWHPEGTVFRTRLRPLTTKVKALPKLEFEIFDPSKGEYQLVTTEAVALRILPRDGQDYFDSKTLGGDKPSLTTQSAGVWQNAEINTMDEILNALGNFLADHFWWLLVLGPVLFAGLLPRAKECRRRALDPEYRKRQLAYLAFAKLPEGSAEKWQAFREYVATSLDVAPGAWTSGDAQRRLADLGVKPEDIEIVVKSQESMDAEAFSGKDNPARIPALNEVTKRLAKVLSQVALLMLAVFFSGSAMGASADWNQASGKFDQALKANVGSDEAVPLFTDSALIFEACARAKQNAGEAWLNAGNAWFQAGEIGRSIASYRQAEVYRPFDETIRDNLSAARALAVDVVEDRQSSWWLRWPFRWIAAVLIPVSLGFWLVGLGWIRFRGKGWLMASLVLLVASLGLGGLALLARNESGRAGVVVVPEVYGRKGPSFSYQTAFNEALHDGLEIRIAERRDGWLQIELADKRRAWVPESQVQVITR
ncbi:hypothetical protein [Haloferula sp.]|uniref:hypothetical protein n=1 Tax=Haloferula sp. TaxID=2497595 RepID=UPI00329FD8E3